MSSIVGITLARPRVWLLAGIAAAVALVCMATGARAAEVVYWDNYGAGNVGFANIDGTGGGLLNLGSQTIKNPEGMAYDTVTNRLFVTTGEGAARQILAINLDGTGATPFVPPASAPIEEPEGVAIDPLAGTIYWENTKEKGSIAWAKLDGSQGGVLNTTGTTLEDPCCRIAIDPTGGRVYWVNSGATPETIGFANLNNTGGGGTLNTTGTSIEPGGEALALDSAGGRIYFAGVVGGKNQLGWANLNGGGGDLATTGAAVEGPWGLAVNPAIGRLYWGNESNSGATAQTNALGFAALAGGSGGNISMALAPVNEPQDPVIIRSPAAAGTPTLSRAVGNPASLTCSQGTWGGDFVGGFVYQAPRTYAYQWTLSGAPVPGATGTTYTATAAGSYACVVTAANQVGSTAQTSAAVTLKAATLKLTAKKAKGKAGGLATVSVKATNEGDIQSKAAKVCAKLSKKAKKALKAPKCKSLGKLPGRAKKSVKLKFKVAKDAVAGAYKVTFSVKGSAGKSATSKVTVKAAKH